MTSSLVGSEMCIRDRARAMVWSIKAVPCSITNVPTFRVLVFSMPWTVSYTHLTLPTICSV
eukprot:619722-Prorocentrum_lima.AAC.1